MRYARSSADDGLTALGGFDPPDEIVLRDDDPRRIDDIDRPERDGERGISLARRDLDGTGDLFDFYIFEEIDECLCEIPDIFVGFRISRQHLDGGFDASREIIVENGISLIGKCRACLPDELLQLPERRDGNGSLDRVFALHRRHDLLDRRGVSVE